MLTFAQFGAGRIGRIHAANIAAHPRARLARLVDVQDDAARALAESVGAVVCDASSVFADPAIDAVVIGSPTDTHADLIEEAARSGKAIFCEKPIDLSEARVNACLATVAKAGVPLMLGFNRRFDPNFAELRRRIDEGRIGKVEQVIVISRDPGPPPAGYIRSSGGMFRDMTIHDFDMARWLLGEEPTLVHAVGSVLVDPEIGRLGDIDTATVVLTTPSGRQAVISNTRRAVYGYDQRIEVHGSGGMLQAANVPISTVSEAGAGGITGDKPMPFFLERYAAAYQAEIDAFIAAVEAGTPPNPGGEDGRRALMLADAAIASLKQGQPVAV
ncbi:inositol 2-dehydrogenase [Arenibaculum pallidiluteum]|uniref:inositol 2-dehydrogenase n=1 Tax=Arenibaculum pallidiluteum TaxID=2812559 RepID=UPI001A9693DC|nr:inositol 2-dehydrogenase [Arenibaculum pallidiluteum]